MMPLRLKQHFLIIIIILGAFTFSAFQSSALAEDAPLIIAIDKAHSPFSVVSPTGEPTGLFVEMWQLWSEETGRPVEFLASDRSGSLQSLLNGKADIHSGLVSNEQRALGMDFSNPIHEISTSLFFQSDEENSPSLSEMDGKKIGTLRDSSQYDYLTNNFPNIKAITYSDGRSLVLALVKGEVDAILNKNLDVEANLASLGLQGVLNQGNESCFSNSIVAGVRKGRTKLVQLINEGFRKIPLEKLVQLEKRWLIFPKDRYYDDILDDASFTEEEKAWIRANPTVTVAVSNYLSPLDIVNDYGTYSGFNSDLLDLLSEQTGLQFEPSFNSKWPNIVKAAMTGDADIGLSMSKTSVREQRLIFSLPYANLPQQVVTRRESHGIMKWADLKGKRVAVIKNAAIVETLRRAVGDDGELIEVENRVDLLPLVSSGKADALVAGWFTYQKAQAVARDEGLKVATCFVGESGNLRIATNNAKPLLAKILEKGLKRIDHQTIIDLRQKWFSFHDKSVVEFTAEEKSWIANNPTIKVATTLDWPPFEFIDGNGQYAGITSDILQLVAERTGLEIDVELRPWNESVQKLKSGELDVGSGMAKTPERSKYLAFTSPFISSEYAIWVRQERDDIVSIQDLSGKTIAVEEGGFLQEYLESKHPDVNLLLASGTLEALKTVIMGRADAFIGTLPVGSYIIKQNLLSGLKIAGYYEDNHFDLSMGVSANKPVLRDILQKGLDTVTDNEINAIVERYLGEDVRRHLILTDREKNWLEEHKNIRLGVDPSWFPFEAVGADGQYEGVISEYVNWINERLGVDMSPVLGATWSEVEQMAKNKGIDVIPGITKTAAREEFLSFTSPYLTLPLVLVVPESSEFVGRLADLRGKRIAACKGSVSQTYLEQDYPTIEVVTFDTLKECLEAVDNGYAEAVFDNLSSLTYMMRFYGLSGLKVAATTPYNFELAFGVRKDWAEFVPILEKALMAIAKDDVRSFKDRWVNTRIEERIDWQMVWKVSFAIVLIGGVLLVVITRSNRRLARAVHERTLAEQNLSKLAQDLDNKNTMLQGLSQKLSKYLSPQIYNSIFVGEKDVELTTQRKKLTVFFCDIKDFTQTSEDLQPEDLTYLLNTYFTEMSAIAFKHGATIDKFIGDAMLMFFGDPETKGVQEDARSCLRMAIEMQQRMAELKKVWQEKGYEHPFEMRVGINTGYCNVGNFGSESRMDYTIIGGEVNLAARLESIGDKGGILMSYDTYALTKDMVETEPREPIQVKGIRREIRPYAVTNIYADVAEKQQIVREGRNGFNLFLNPDKIDKEELEKTKKDLEAALKRLNG